MGAGGGRGGDRGGGTNWVDKVVGVGWGGVDLLWVLVR